MQVYPVMDGLELWVTSYCGSDEGAHVGHLGTKASSFIDAERVDKYGPEVAIGSEMTFLLAENPLLAKHARC